MALVNAKQEGISYANMITANATVTPSTNTILAGVSFLSLTGYLLHF